jgi:predicted O-linked N-acetylglucosamine transferase (SPINDLY family)
VPGRQPQNHVAWNNLGACYNALYRQADAADAYRKSIAINAGYEPAWNNLGNVLLDLEQPLEAIAAYQRTLAINPAHADAHAHLGNALRDLGRLDEAVAAYARALEFKPDHAVAEGMMLHQMQYICDWSRQEQMLARCAALGIETAGITPFAGLSMEDHPPRQLARAQKYAAEQFKTGPAPFNAGRVAGRQRIRIGYFSSDFHENHPVMQLFTGVVRCHDRSGFELYGYDFSGSEGAAAKQTFKAGFDLLTDVRNTDTDALVALARSHELDIVVDLNGYTAHNRMHWFQYWLAPIQVNFLGYPGTMGADFIDYIVADPVVIPKEQRAYYSEKVIWLPNCYLPNDDQREIAGTATARADFDLPEDAVVFCCFNAPYKIGPREFDIWMRVLGKVEGSVLWVSKSNQ